MNLGSIFSDNVNLIGPGIDEIRIPIHHDVPITIHESSYPTRFSADFQVKRIRLEKFGINSDLEYTLMNQCSMHDLETTKDIAVREFTDFLVDRIQKLKEAGINIYVERDPFSFDTYIDNIKGTNTFKWGFHYKIIEGEDYYKHCFVDSIWREGAVEEAIEHCKNITKREVSRICNEIKNGKS